MSGQAIVAGGHLSAGGITGGSIVLAGHNILEYGSLTADGSAGSAGKVVIDFTGRYQATQDSLTSARGGATGQGGVIEIDGANAGNLFTSGQYLVGGGLGDGWLKYNDLGHIFHLPLNALNVRFGQFELDLPFTNARTPYLSGYDIFGQGALAQGPACGAGVTVCGTTNNPFILGTPQRGIEFGGSPNNGNFVWSVAVVDGTNSAYGLGPALTARNSKDVYLHTSYQFDLERDPESRHAIQAAGPTGPHDHTSIRVGAFYYHGSNQQNQGGTLFPFTGTIESLTFEFGPHKKPTGMERLKLATQMD